MRSYHSDGGWATRFDLTEKPGKGRINQNSENINSQSRGILSLHQLNQLGRQLNELVAYTVRRV